MSTSNPFDLNHYNFSASRSAALAVETDELTALFEKLEKANEIFTRNQGEGFVSALHAVGLFLAKHSPDGNGHYSRPFEIAYAELRHRPGTAKRIFPRSGSGSGGVSGRASDQSVKAAAAWVCEKLHHECGLRTRVAADSVTSTLKAAGFNFGARRSNKSAAVLAWRRDLPRGTSRAAQAYRRYVRDAEVKFSGNPLDDAARLQAWFSQLLIRAGYGDVA